MIIIIIITVVLDIIVALEKATIMKELEELHAHITIFQTQFTKLWQWFPHSLSKATMEELEELDAHIAILKEGLRAKQPPLKVTIVTAIDTIIIFIVTIILVVINSLNIVWKIVSSIDTGCGDAAGSKDSQTW